MRAPLVIIFLFLPSSHLPSSSSHASVQGGEGARAGPDWPAPAPRSTTSETDGAREHAPGEIDHGRQTVGEREHARGEIGRRRGVRGRD
jgi:hypothetical protein